MSVEVLDELGEEARAAWDTRLARLIARATDQLKGRTQLKARLSEPGELATLDWVAFPTRVSSCLTRGEALELLDGPTDGRGGRALQEEYAEWRVVADEGRIRRVEITTELPEYWRILAAYEPRRTLALVARFAGKPEVSCAEVYGLLDPYGARVTPAQRQRAFRIQMLGAVPGAYNDGRRAICCMIQGSNTIAALIRLAAEATTPWAVRDPGAGHLRSLTCNEAIPLMANAAMPERASDPLVVERLARLAFEGRDVELSHPAGVYIHGVEHTRLVTPCGSPVPPEWFTFDRGTVDDDGRTRYRRVVLEVPPSEPFGVDQLIDLATEQPVTYGGQVADLVQVALLVRVSEPRLPPKRKAIDLVGAAADGACEDVRRTHERYRAERAGAAS